MLHLSKKHPLPRWLILICFRKFLTQTKTLINVLIITTLLLILLFLCFVLLLWVDPYSHITHLTPNFFFLKAISTFITKNFNVVDIWLLTWFFPSIILGKWANLSFGLSWSERFLILYWLMTPWKLDLLLWRTIGILEQNLFTYNLDFLSALYFACSQI